MRGLVAAVALAAGVLPANGAVTDVAANGFTVEYSIIVAAPPTRVYAALIQPSRWWSSDHTFSGSAANLTLDARAGGCFCEKLADGGSVRHLIVVNVVPGRLLRLEGMLGPFQAVAGNGVMTFTLTADGSGTKLDMVYQIAGNADMKIGGKGYDFWSGGADKMLGEQMGRLKRTLETGPPDPKP